MSFKTATCFSPILQPLLVIYHLPSLSNNIFFIANKQIYSYKINNYPLQKSVTQNRRLKTWHTPQRMPQQKQSRLNTIYQGTNKGTRNIHLHVRSTTSFICSFQKSLNVFDKLRCKLWHSLSPPKHLVDTTNIFRICFALQI